MSKINCSLIKDLLPLYIDDLCSKETTEIVGNHLEICEECNKEYETLKTEPKVKPQQDNSQELIKKVNKKFGKDKKKAIIRSVSIVVAITIVIGIVAFLRVPLELAEYCYYGDGFYEMVHNSEEWETGEERETNFSSQYFDLYINEKHGEYTVENHETAVTVRFSEDKEILLYDESYPVDSFDDKVRYYNSMSFPILHSAVKKGMEVLGFDSDIAPGFDYSYVKEMITMDVPNTEFFTTPSDYAIDCAYYAFYSFAMPLCPPGNYYLVSENESCVAWGITMGTQGDMNYDLNFQPKNDLNKCYSISISGFTKEEAQEIFKYAVIK
ncbi:MAG: zf-HC2 domain-containing protein [Ruminococcaceae bacterium]|nr:zf-HC2 domain-containing protein [Oscillospiraceae bacterium]